MCGKHVFPAAVEQNERSQRLVWVLTQRDNLFCFLFSGTIIVGLKLCFYPSAGGFHKKKQTKTPAPTTYSSTTALQKQHIQHPTHPRTHAPCTAAPRYVSTFVHQFVAASYWEFHAFMKTRQNGDRASPSPDAPFHASRSLKWTTAPDRLLKTHSGAMWGGRGVAVWPRGVRWRSGEPVPREAHY